MCLIFVAPNFQQKIFHNCAQNNEQVKHVNVRGSGDMSPKRIIMRSNLGGSKNKSLRKFLLNLCITSNVCTYMHIHMQVYNY